jgi:hypothetical protein
MASLPSWAREVIARYESGTAGCFVLHGNINDRLLLPPGSKKRLGRLHDFLLEALLPRFEVVLSYELGFGLRVERGGETFAEWPTAKDLPDFPARPLEAVRFLTQYLIYCRNLKAVTGKSPQVAIIIRQTQLLAPAIPNALNNDLNALASLLRSWAADVDLQDHGQAAFLISDHLHSLHPLVASNPRVSAVQVPLPEQGDIEGALEVLAEECPLALKDFRDDLSKPAERLTGTTLSAVEGMLKRREYEKRPLHEGDLSELKKSLVEADCEGLIEFVEPNRNLDDVIGIETVKSWLRQDLALWKQDELQALPMGYLFCGPVGTGKTYLAECLAGEAEVPVVTLRNFRDRWVGSTEANLEKIFALLHALGRCIVFVDEADQALGRRAAQSGDSGVGSRVYSMIAKEMSDPDNRGHLLWVLASSRPDLIEIDLKRPGRVDVKVPLFPTTTPEDGFALLRALCRSRKLDVQQDLFEELKDRIPDLLTPGAAEALAVKCYRLSRLQNLEPGAALRACLKDYIPPVPHEILRYQMKIAADESTEASFVPKRIRELLDQA